jgi:predicted transcriptional regulator
MAQTATMTIRLPSGVLSRLEKLAGATGRTKSFLAVEAIQSYLELEAWQVEEIKKGIAEADTGDFASDAEVDAVLAKWRGRQRRAR